MATQYAPVKLYYGKGTEPERKKLSHSQHKSPKTQPIKESVDIPPPPPPLRESKRKSPRTLYPSPNLIRERHGKLEFISWLCTLLSALIIFSILVQFFWVVFSRDPKHVRVGSTSTSTPTTMVVVRNLPDECGVGKVSVNKRCVPDTALSSNLVHNESDPCTDMYRYACGRFVDSQCTLDADDFHNLAYVEQQNEEERYEAILRSLETTSVESNDLVQNFYTSCKRSLTTVEGGDIMAQLLVDIAACVNMEQLSRVMGEMAAYDMILPFAYSRELDPLNTSSLVDCFIPDGVIPRRRDIMEQHMIQVARYSPKRAAGEAESVVKIETYLAELLARYKDTQRAQGFDQYMSSAQYSRERVQFTSLKKWMSPNGDGFSLAAFFAGLSAPYTPSLTASVWVHTPNYFMNLDFGVFDLSQWMCYLSYSVIESSVVHNFDPSARAFFSPGYTFHRGYDPMYALPWNRPPKFTRATLLSLDPTTDLPELCIDLTMSYLPVLLDKQLVTSLSREDMALAQTIAERVRRAYIDSVENGSPSLPGEHRAFLLQKLHALTIDIGFPKDWPPSRDGLSFSARSHLSDNILRIRRFHIVTELSTSSNMMRYMYDDSVSSANAFYHMQTNNLIVNAGLMKPPIFSSSYPDTSLYAGFAFFVAHEIAHAFDRYGYIFDASGNFVAPKNRINIDALYPSDCFSPQTVNEDIADRLGLLMAYKALSSLYEYNHLGDALSTDFFLGFAQFWCSCMSRATIDSISTHSRHSLPWNRVNMACHANPAFLAAYACPAPSSTVSACKTPIY
jgi:predicted metalloendopeptidase